MVGVTLEELARELGIDPDGLRRQIDFYNEQCAKGEDLQFKRGKRYLKPLLSAPFYGVKVEKTFTNTQGGPERNERAELIKRGGGVIAHLYAAGELGSVFPNLYNGGGNIGEALAFGRIAGMEAARVKTDADPQSVMQGAANWHPKAVRASAAQAGEVTGRSRGIGGAIVLGVKFDGDRIQAVRVIEHHETPGIGAKALESLPAAAVAGNGKIDSVSGATITTKGFREAIADAIKNHSAKKQ